MNVREIEENYDLKEKQNFRVNNSLEGYQNSSLSTPSALAWLARTVCRGGVYKILLLLISL